MVILNPHIFPINLGWRLGFGAGAIIGLVILYLREFIPESPRWLITHDRREEAEKTVRDVEDEVHRETGERLADPHREHALRIHARHDFGLRAILCRW